MTGVINTGSIPKLLWPGLNKIWGDEYLAHVAEYDKLFEKSTSDKAYEEDVAISTFGFVPVKPEGSQIQYDSMKQFFVSRYTHITYALGFIITREAIEDNQYMSLGEKGTRALAFSFNQTRENIGHNIFNNGFSGGPTYGDGKVFFATDHPLDGGAGTYSNVLSPAADLSEAALEDLLNQIEGLVDFRGLKINVKAESLHVPFQLQFEAKRILADPDRPGTADRDINAMYHMGMFPKGFFVHHYFTDPDAFFVKTNIREGVRYFDRRVATFEDDNDFDTENAKYKCTGRYSFGVTDARKFFASQGA
jgi:hypothetical protein